MEAPFADAVIVAAGASRRMAGIDKLEAPLFGRPLLAWTVEALARATTVRRLVVVTAAERVARLTDAGWLRAAARQHKLSVVAGGAQRSDSVRAGLAATDADVVLVHDGARPLASPGLADAVANAARREGAAIPALPVVDALKRIADGRVTASIEREGAVAAQTPQAARRELLEAAFSSAGSNSSYNDEASLLAAHGVPVATVPGEPANLKITQPADLELARALFAARVAANEISTGFGQDSHPFGPGDGLWLGGVLIEDAPRLFGHSDGDVALHALATAILAGCRQGDLGRHFPPTDRLTAGAASTELLSAVLERARSDGWRPSSAQVSLLGARPRLGAARLEEMRSRVAQLVGLEREHVTLTASSGNLAGPEGAGLAISASAFVTLVRG